MPCPDFTTMVGGAQGGKIMAIRELDLEKDLTTTWSRLPTLKHHSRSRTIRRPIGPCAKSGKPRPGSSRCSDSPTSGKRRSTLGLNRYRERSPHDYVFTGHLKTYHFKLHQANPRIKTIKLPAGNCSCGKRSPNTAGMITS